MNEHSATATIRRPIETDLDQPNHLPSTSSFILQTSNFPPCLWFIWKNGNASTKRSAFRTAEIYNHPAMAKAHSNFQLT